MSVVAIPIELGNVERPGNVKPSFVITFFFCSFNEMNCKQHILKLSELRHVTWDLKAAWMHCKTLSYKKKKVHCNRPLSSLLLVKQISTNSKAASTVVF